MKLHDNKLQWVFDQCEIIENLEEITTILDLKCAAKTHLNSIYGTMVTDSIYCDTDSIKRTEKTND